MVGALVEATADVRTDLRMAMRQVVASVAVVTTLAEGKPGGMTATAVSIVSLDPPSLLVCINRSSRLHPAIVQARRFRITFLDQSQCEIARAFGGDLSQEARFSVGDWDFVSPYGPRLAGALADVDCELAKALDHGSHTIFIGEARAVRRRDGEVLLYGDGCFRPAA